MRDSQGVSSHSANPLSAHQFPSRGPWPSFLFLACECDTTIEIIPLTECCVAAMVKRGNLRFLQGRTDMRILNLLLAVAGSTLIATGAFAQNVNIRGTIAGFDGKVINVKTIDGRDVAVDVPEALPVAATKPFTMADIKPGMKLGVTTIKGANGSVMAIDVRPIPPTANEGLSPYDLAPESTMTNAVLEGTAQGTNGQELTLNYKTGTVKALVTPQTAMSQSTPGERSDLKTGETIYVAARKDGDKFVAVRIQVGKNGVKPTQ
jgi:hypothetical protein